MTHSPLLKSRKSFVTALFSCTSGMLLQQSTSTKFYPRLQLVRRLRLVSSYPSHLVLFVLSRSSLLFRSSRSVHFLSRPAQSSRESCPSHLVRLVQSDSSPSFIPVRPVVSVCPSFSVRSTPSVPVRPSSEFLPRRSSPHERNNGSQYKPCHNKGQPDE